MKTKGKAWHLIATVLLIVVFVYTAFFGVYAKYGDTTTTYIKGAKDIRFGVDIKGGVNVTFVPSDGYDATEEQLEAAQLVIENRLVALNVTDYELYVDNNSDSLILEFPWQSGETDFDPEAAIDEIGTTAYLTFREGSSADGELILDGSMIESAAAQYGPVSNGGASEYFVSLKFTDDGAKAFGDATTKLAASGGTISIWLDDENVSTATVNTAITDGSAIITSSASNPFTQEQVVKMARQINSGALPFALKVDSYSTVSPSLGENSLSAMVLAGVIAFALIVVDRSRNDSECPPLALWASSAEEYFYSRATADSLRAVRCCIFTERAQKGNLICLCLFPAETAAQPGNRPLLHCARSGEKASRKIPQDFPTCN